VRKLWEYNYIFRGSRRKTFFYKNRGYFMEITENNRDMASNNNTDKVPQVQALQESMTSIKHKFLVMSSQGGVGKTGVIVSLALSLAKKG
jgi:Mrp family chromosome partitioning ATPase